MAEKKLTKRELKAQAFKKKAKKPQLDEEMAVPESDIVEDKKTTEEAEVKETKAEKTVQPKPQSNKRKGQSIDVPQEGSEPANKRIKRTPGQEGGNRYILFVGNLPYQTTKEELQNHFHSAGEIKSVRLLTDKVTGKPKGFAFVEFGSAKDLKKGLAFHHTFFKKRQINVELTAGGGGTGENRKEKLKVKHERLTQERTKKHNEMKNVNTEKQSSYQTEPTV
ncbi:hypothetical protein BDB01DRAFT_844975 [Pilobolus umbonatus]|nr:hypothetical protein BDB01DRAFT_844975 [Pilobolus umbonatus]